MKKIALTFILIFTLILCSCNNNEQTYTSVNEISVQSENINYLQIGKTQGLIFKETLWDYFGTSCNKHWKIDSENYMNLDEYETRQYQRCIGLYKDESKTDYKEMTFNQAKDYLINELNLTKDGFDDLCLNAPSGYAEINGEFYIGQGDGGESGWDCSYITDYMISENDIVIFNCERIGFAGTFEDGYWDYENDKVESFIFSLKKENNIWKFNGCSNYNAFFNYFIGFKSDYVKPL